MASMIPSKRPSSRDAAGVQKKPKQSVNQDQVEKMLTEARARAAAVAAKLNSAKAIPPPPPPAVVPQPPTASAQTAADRIAAMKARVSGAVSRSSGLAASVPNRPQGSAYRRDEPEMEEASKARGGLDVGLHPALLGDGGDAGSAKRGKGGMQPKFATTMANRRSKGKAEKRQLEIQGPSPDMTDPSKNPYFDPNLASKVVAPRRISKTLVFNQKGKYIEQANALRRQAALEAMKKRIAEAARKVGIDEDMHADKAFAVSCYMSLLYKELVTNIPLLKHEPPPEIEWWDQGLTTASSYESITPGTLLITVPDTIVTHYVQHPVLLSPPQDKLAPPLKPFPLTKKEQKKVRRQRRAEALKEKQAKVRLGLEPPPPPKIKKSNLMRVLGEEAVKDPTAVEARVNREIRERHETHLKMNEERMLSKEQRLEKLVANQEKDLARGIHVLVFRIETLANGRHRYKININADQHALTGICILNPKFNLVIVEGGQHSITKFKKLMMNRIDWKETITAREGSKEPEGDAGAEEGQAVDMTRNMCTLVWEGEVRQKGFKRFTTERFPSDALARERLERARMEYMWTQAKNAVSKET